MIEELAEILHEETASSRTLVDKEWFPSGRHIGFSGKVVRPDVIITCGISGSIQFMAGMKTSKTIITINSDSNAPFFQ